jgi:hypothetical protein
MSAPKLVFEAELVPEQLQKFDVRLKVKPTGNFPTVFPLYTHMSQKDFLPFTRGKLRVQVVFEPTEVPIPKPAPAPAAPHGHKK